MIIIYSCQLIDRDSKRLHFVGEILAQAAPVDSCQGFRSASGTGEGNPKIKDIFIEFTSNIYYYRIVQFA